MARTKPLQPKKMSTILVSVTCVQLSATRLDNNVPPHPRRRKCLAPQPNARRNEKGRRSSGIPQPDTPSWCSSCESRGEVLSATPVFFFSSRVRIQTGRVCVCLCGVFLTGGIRSDAWLCGKQTPARYVRWEDACGEPRGNIFCFRGNRRLYPFPFPISNGFPPVPVPRTAARNKRGRDVISHLYRGDVKKEGVSTHFQRRTPPRSRTPPL